MISPESRYQDATKAFTVGHTYDAFGRVYLNGDDAVPVARSAVHETLFRLTVPSASAAAPLEYVSKEGETLSYCAWKLMSAHSNWWKLAEANAKVWYPLDLPPGTSLRVPL